MVDCAEMARDDPRRLQIGAVLHAHRKGVQCVEVLTSQGRDDAGVDAAAQEGAQRHIAHQVRGNGALQRVAQLGGYGLGRVGLLWRVGDCVKRRKSAVRVEARARRKLAYAAAAARQRFELGGEHKRAILLAIVQRLDTDRVAGDEQAPAVDDRKGVHAVEMIDGARFIFLVEVQNRLGVAGGTERVALSKRWQELRKIVDLAVGDDRPAPIGAIDRLVPTLRVHDAQPAVPDHAVRGIAHTHALRVRPTMAQRIQHMPDAG